MLQNSFLQHLLLFHKGTKCQTLRYGRWRSPHKCATKSKLKNTLQFPLYETSSFSFHYLLFVGYFYFFLLNQRLVLLKTTCCFTENDVLFYWKWRVVLLKMTACFTENDVLFYWKWRVVLLKTTACFFSSNGWILFQLWGMMKTMRKWIVKIPIIILSRACAYAHLQEFYHFCCHKCHSILVNHYTSTHCPYPRTYFNR